MKISPRCHLIVLSIFLIFSSVGEGAQAQECSKVLVTATMNKSVLSIQNLSIASKVTDDEWREANKTFGANGVIYGVPVGASFGDYQNNVRSLSNVFNLNEYQQYSEVFASSQLDANSLEAYKFCLANKGGIEIYVSDVGPVSAPSYTIWIINTPFPNQLT
jgi:hypothetical protein